MPTFKYSAINADGKRVNGVLSSQSERAARQQIKATNLTPLSLNLTRTSSLRRVKVSNKNLLFATRQIATLLDSGIALDETLKSIASEVDDKSLAAALHAIREDILQGTRIAEAMASHQSIFNDTYRSLISAGDTAGNLHLAFSNLADYLEEAALVRQQVVSALTYPIILLVFSIGVVVALLTFVMPQVVDQFVRAGATLPLLTRTLMTVSDYVWVILVASGAIFIGLYFLYINLLKDNKAAVSMHRKFLKIPLVGSFILNAEIERFARIMHLMMKSGLNLDVAMQQAHVVIGNRYISQIILQSRSELVEGKDFIISLRESKIFPSLFVQLLSSGYKSGNLVFMFEKVTQYMKGEIENKRSVVLSLLEPLVIIFMGGIILLIVLAILIPIMQMNTIALG
ncbi:type II secretion system F family protein [Gammaproteobacteria bacterium]|jgi:general secretion pathway protein F|nr:type II secretion system F family protein [Gammaproteobacteria bacterium]MDC3381907.1 type II secretion system F family protein [Gammaproteobacteria bacterium]|tara:strand:- start:1312 stop:2508 length:1197 start_codon:yes stop_codon:yes gene_type:complete